MNVGNVGLAETVVVCGSGLEQRAVVGSDRAQDGLAWLDGYDRYIASRVWVSRAVPAINLETVAFGSR